MGRKSRQKRQRENPPRGSPDDAAQLREMAESLKDDVLAAIEQEMGRTIGPRVQHAPDED
jgi:hypothetical protein